MNIQEFDTYLNKISDESKKQRMREILDWTTETFTILQPKIAWNQPMFTHHGTYIIGYAAYKEHISVAPEPKAMLNFCDAIKNAGYSQTQNMFRIKYDQAIDYKLLNEIINYNINDKANCPTFWRK